MEEGAMNKKVIIFLAIGVRVVTLLGITFTRKERREPITFREKELSNIWRKDLGRKIFRFGKYCNEIGVRNGVKHEKNIFDNPFYHFSGNVACCALYRKSKERTCYVHTRRFS